MARQLLWVVAAACLLFCACSRELVRLEEKRSEPEYLGRFSGVYEGLGYDTDPASRTILVQLGDSLLLAPFIYEAGEPKLEGFAAVIPISDGGLEAPAFDHRATPAFPVEQFFGDTATCADEAPAFQGLGDFFALWAQCDAGPCTVPCQIPNLFSFADSRDGRCLEGQWCAYDDVRLGGQLGRDALDIYFDQDTIVPESRFSLDCPAPWRKCLRSRKLCDFDSRVAGVYSASLDGGAPFDLAVAVANHVPAIVLFAAEHVFFGELDLFTLEFSADDGEDPGDAGFMLHDPAVTTSLRGRLVESGGVISLHAAWEEQSLGGNQVRGLSAERLSGVAPGTSCAPHNECPPAQAHCPAGEQAGQGQLSLSSQIEANGCVTTSCSRTTPPTGLCAPLPDCGGETITMPWGGTRFERYTLEMRCPVAASSCEAAEQCLAIGCPSGDEPPGGVEGVFVDTRCDAGDADLTLSYDGLLLNLVCSAAQPECPNPPVECPLGQSYSVAAELQTSVDASGCLRHSCEQLFQQSQLCAGATLPSCQGGEVPIARVRQATPPAADCVEYICDAACSGATCGGCPACVDDPPPDCGARPVRARWKPWCSGCVELVCDPYPFCSTEPPECLISNMVWALETATKPVQMEPCFLTACEQHITDASLCAGETLTGAAARCTDPEIAVAVGADVTGDGSPDCVQFECRAALGEWGTQCASPWLGGAPVACAAGINALVMQGCPLYLCGGS